MPLGLARGIEGNGGSEAKRRRRRRHRLLPLRKRLLLLLPSFAGAATTVVDFSPVTVSEEIISNLHIRYTDLRFRELKAHLAKL